MSWWRPLLLGRSSGKWRIFLSDSRSSFPSLRNGDCYKEQARHPTPLCRRSHSMRNIPRSYRPTYDNISFSESSLTLIFSITGQLSSQPSHSQLLQHAAEAPRPSVRPVMALNGHDRPNKPPSETKETQDASSPGIS